MNRLDYSRQLAAVTDFIYSHLDDDLDLNRLADIACLSPYHWHRVYQALRGETVAETVKRLRLQRAAGYLAGTDLSIPELARRSGYPNVQSFTRIFKAAYGLPPAAYRTGGGHVEYQSDPRADRLPHPVEIRSTTAITLAAAAHTGPFMEIGRAFTAVTDVLTDLSAPRMIAIYLDDPSLVPDQRCRSVAGVVVGEDEPVPEPLLRTMIPAGRHAVLRYRGPYASMHAAYEWLYGEWLLGSGEVPGEQPVFEEYLNDPVDTAPADLLTEIFLPLG